MTDKQEYLSPQELSELIGISRGTIYQWIHSRRIPYYKFNGGLVKFYRRDIDAWLEKKRIEIITQGY